MGEGCVLRVELPPPLRTLRPTAAACCVFAPLIRAAFVIKAAEVPRSVFDNAELPKLGILLIALAERATAALLTVIAI